MSRSIALAVVAVASLGLAACSGEKPPTVTPQSTPTQSPSQSPPRAWAPTPEEELIAAFAKRAPTPHAASPCPKDGGKWIHGRQTRPTSAGAFAYIYEAAEVDLDADPAPEFVVYAGCRVQEWAHDDELIIVAFDNDYSPLGTVIPAREGHFSTVEARDGQGMAFTVHRYSDPGEVDKEFRTQKREFVLENGDWRQVAGGTAFQPLPKADLVLGNVKAQRGAQSGDLCTYTFTVSVTNLGPVTSGPILIHVGETSSTPSGPRLMSETFQEAHPPLASGAKADITVRSNLRCATNTMVIGTYTGGADPNPDNNVQSLPLSGS